MNDDTILQLGGFCTELLGSEMFDAVTKLYSQQCAVDMLQTAPHEQKAREGKSPRRCSQSFSLTFSKARSWISRPSRK